MRFASVSIILFSPISIEAYASFAIFIALFSFKSMALDIFALSLAVSSIFSALASLDTRFEEFPLFAYMSPRISRSPAIDVSVF